MRNLKRALSLALAAVMVLGMMVIGAGAMSIDDFADKDEIANQDAVALMVDLGVLEGLDGPNGTTIFQPEATLQRQALAKIAYMISTGATDWDVYATASPKFTDLGNSWAKGAIEYCNVMGYITGYTETIFGPEDTLTVAQTATVLLRVLGYDSKAQGYNGDAWMINAMKDAKTEGLLEGVGNTNAGSPISRQDACQMAYNALFANTRQANMITNQITGQKYFSGYTVNSTTLGQETYDLYQIPATVTGIANGNAVLAAATTPKLHASNGKVKLTDVKLPATPDMVGSNVVFYVKGTATESSGVVTVTAKKLISSALAVGSSNTVYTMTGPVGQINTLAGLEAAGLVNLADSLTYYYNGGAGASYTGKIGQRGVIVDLKDTTGDGEADTVVITDKAVATLTAAPTVTTTNGKTTVTIAQIGIANADAAKVIGYEGLDKGDVILYVTMGGVTYIEKAEKMTGSITGYNTGKGSLIGGSYYWASGLTGTAFVDNSTVTTTAEYDFYLDNGKNIVAAAPTGSGAVTTTLSVVGATSWVVINNTGDMAGNTSKYLQARLVHTDGTSELVRVASIDGYTPIAAGTKFADLGAKFVQSATKATIDANTADDAAAPEKGSDSVDPDVVIAGEYSKVFNDAGTCIGKYVGVTDTAGANADTVLAPKNFYNYSVNAAGAYVLTSVNAATQGTNTALSGNKITNNAPGGAFYTGLVGNNATVFIYASTDASGNTSYAIYTGVANVPTTADDVTGSALKNAQGYVTYVYADLGAKGTVAESTDYVYILSNDKTQITGTNNFIYDVLLNGVKTTLTLNANTYSAGQLCEVDSISSNNVYTLKTAETFVTGIKANAGGTIIVSTNTAHRYEAGTPAYIVDGTNVTATTMDAIPLNATNDIFVKVVNGVATVAYVTVKSQAPDVVTLEAGSSNGATVAKDIKTSGNPAATGSVTGWSTSACNVKITAPTAATGTTVKTISINGQIVYDAADATTKDGSYTIPATGTYTVVVTVEDNNSHALASFNYSFTVAE